MNKSDLIDVVANETRATKQNVETVLNSIVSNIQRTLKKGGSVKLVRFATFETQKRAGRTGRNPKTGEPVEIPAKTVAKAKISQSFMG